MINKAFCAIRLFSQTGPKTVFLRELKITTLLYLPRGHESLFLPKLLTIKYFAVE